MASSDTLSPELLRLAKRHGFSDAQIAQIRGISEETVRQIRWAYGLHPVYKTVDTCAAEFAADTPYHYSSYDDETEVAPRERPAILILGSGPNRIGQGIEFDYSCVHASLTLATEYETVMVNCNPETVSTDYDISNRLYFEPLTLGGRAGDLRGREGCRTGWPVSLCSLRPDATFAGECTGGCRCADYRYAARSH